MLMKNSLMFRVDKSIFLLIPILAVVVIFPVSDHKVIHELFTFSRVWLPFEKIPDHVVEATLATEDRVFYDHWGIHLKRVIKPIVVNLLSFSKFHDKGTALALFSRHLLQLAQITAIGKTKRHIILYGPIRHNLVLTLLNE